MVIHATTASHYYHHAPAPICIADDDSSTSSTIAVHDLTKFQQQHQVVQKSLLPKKRPAPKKSVHFNTELNEEYANFTWCKEDCKDSWYEPQEYRDFKTSNKSAAKLAAKTDVARMQELGQRSYQSVVQHSYNCCRDRVQGQDNHMIVLNQQERNNLSEWIVNEFNDHYGQQECRIALEKYLVPSVRRELHARRMEVIDTVLSIQDTLISNSYEQMSEYIRCAILEISRPAQVYAVQMANALAHAEQKQRFFA